VEVDVFVGKTQRFCLNFVENIDYFQGNANIKLNVCSCFDVCFCFAEYGLDMILYFLILGLLI